MAAALLGNIKDIAGKIDTKDISQAMDTLGNADTLISQATGALGSMGESGTPMAALVPDAAAVPVATKEPKITDEEKKKEVLKAYYNVIIEQKDAVQQKFMEALDQYLKANLDMSDKRLKDFIEDITYSQMNSYFKDINTSYVKHAFIIQIFLKQQSLLYKVLENSISAANNIEGTNNKVSTIFNAIKESLAEINQQEGIIRGGNGTHLGGNETHLGGNATDLDASKIAEIAFWFPDERDRQRVNYDITYTIEAMFRDIMNYDNTFATVVNNHMTKDIFPRIIDAMKKWIESQSIDVDIAILLASIEKNSDIQNTFITSIQEEVVLSENQKRAMNPMDLYNGIMKVSKEKYDEDIKNIFGKKNSMNGGKRGKRSRRAKSKRRKSRKLRRN